MKKQYLVLLTILIATLPANGEAPNRSLASQTISFFKDNEHLIGATIFSIWGLIRLKSIKAQAKIVREEKYAQLNAQKEAEEAQQRLAELTKAQETLSENCKEFKDDLHFSEPLTCFTLLGITEDATKEEIESAYRKLSRKFHPDRSPYKNDAEKANRLFTLITTVKNLAIQITESKKK